MNPDSNWGYCNCGNPIYERNEGDCSDCQILSNEGKVKELLKKHRDHVAILTGAFYKRDLETAVS